MRGQMKNVPPPRCPFRRHRPNPTGRHSVARSSDIASSPRPLPSPTPFCACLPPPAPKTALTLSQPLCQPLLGKGNCMGVFWMSLISVVVFTQLRPQYQQFGQTVLRDCFEELRNLTLNCHHQKSFLPVNQRILIRSRQMQVHFDAFQFF